MCDISRKKSSPNSIILFLYPRLPNADQQPEVKDENKKKKKPELKKNYYMCI